uniref:Globin family profile domain-containing protein n=1 Tax=Chromera velia CCMP2878 TaxID=1169474 RepID=A0A0G4HD16_9ALVE|eukprot:Cvel_6316.t1-p1 / transcript=Cvel_6316.t1 / gene=Cvel_6316 / organism=Chromera_velia_CCMP2878 / gene_product=hypothetical protein / transcript_product=hypothetical protein / location=Cvel_scaffold306:72178-75409(+) / protein_length=428 / sequence_SO=supercontig / SO=protein_coding / is_pseudo=false
MKSPVVVPDDASVQPEEAEVFKQMSSDGLLSASASEMEQRLYEETNALLTFEQKEEIVRSAWTTLSSTYQLQEIGRVLYETICEEAPGLSSRYTKPGEVMALRFGEMLATLIHLFLDFPNDLQQKMEELAIRHVNYNVDLEYLPVFEISILRTVQELYCEGEFDVEVATSFKWMWKEASVAFKSTFKECRRRVLAVQSSWKDICHDFTPEDVTIAVLQGIMKRVPNTTKKYKLPRMSASGGKRWAGGKSKAHLMSPRMSVGGMADSPNQSKAGGAFFIADGEDEDRQMQVPDSGDFCELPKTSTRKFAEASASVIMSPIKRAHQMWSKGGNVKGINLNAVQEAQGDDRRGSMGSLDSETARHLENVAKERSQSKRRGSAANAVTTGDANEKGSKAGQTELPRIGGFIGDIVTNLTATRKAKVREINLL